VSNFQSSDMKRLVGVLGDIKKEIARLGKQLEDTSDAVKGFTSAYNKIEYRTTDDKQREDEAH